MARILRIRKVAKEQKVLSYKRLTELLDPWRMTMPGGPVGRREDKGSDGQPSYR